MTTPSTGLKKLVGLKAETTWATPAGASGAQLMRRVQSMLNLRKQTYASNEIQPDRQIHDFRHGVWTVEGNLDGELSPNTYSNNILAAGLAGTFTAGVSSGAQTDITAAAGPPGTFTTAGAFNYLTKGFKVGDMVRCAGWATGGSTANNARNYRVTALSATVMTVGTAATGAVGQAEAVIAQAAGDSVTISVVGKKLITPAYTSLLDTSFTLEHWFSDNSLSEVFVGCKPDSINIGLPATGLATLKCAWKGQKIITDTAQYFTSPTAVTSTTALAAVNGLVRVNGADLAIVTGISIDSAFGMTTEATVGTNLTPGVFPGVMNIKGQVTMLFLTGTYRDLFINETETSIWATLTTNSAINSDFMSFYLPRVKFGGADKDDKPGAIVQTLPFQALYNINGGTGTTGDSTTLMIQDSLA